MPATYKSIVGFVNCKRNKRADWTQERAYSNFSVVGADRKRTFGFSLAANTWNGFADKVIIHSTHNFILFANYFICSFLRP